MKPINSGKLLVVLTAIFFSIITHSQAQVVKVDTTTYWKKALKTGLNINQASFSSNWKAGGVNSFGFSGRFNYKANYKKNKT